MSNKRPNGQWIRQPPKEAGEGSDFVGDFMEYTAFALSTEIHRKWTAISLVAGALERRVWAKAGDRITYPNLYVLLVAPPGVGKQIIDDAKQLWLDTDGKLHVAPDSVTRASLIDELANSPSTRIQPDRKVFLYHSLIVPAEEFEVLLPHYDSDFISRLNRIWNNPAEHRETRRYGKPPEIKIMNPQLNILAGVQPAYFSAHFQEEAWHTGLIRRIIMVYSAEGPLKDPFQETPNREALRKKLLSRLGLMTKLYGQARWGSYAAACLTKWHMEDKGAPLPTHTKLQFYNSSRTQFVIKLALISAISRTSQLVIEEVDVHRAMEWLFEAEVLMPDIFRQMAGKSDFQVMEECAGFVQNLWNRNRQRPVQTSSVINFLAHRVTSERVLKVLEVMETSGMIARVAGTTDQWLPVPRYLHAQE